MAMDRPWFQLHTRDFLDCKELARCSLGDRYVLVALMCLAHEGTPYGYLADDVGPLSDEYMAARCLVFDVAIWRQAVNALLKARRLRKTNAGVLFVPRMVRDEIIRQKRANGGASSYKNPKVPRRKGYPSDESEGGGLPRVRAPARSDSDSDSSVSVYSSDTEKVSVTEHSSVSEFPDAGKSSNGNLLALSTAATNHGFSEFIGVFLSLGIPMNHKDMQKCARMWEHLGIPQQLAALMDVKDQSEGEWRHRDTSKIPYPWNYLDREEWTRKRAVPARAAASKANEQDARRRRLVEEVFAKRAGGSS